MVLLIIIFGTLYWLDWFTRHNDSITVPELSGIEIDKLDVVLSNSDLHYEVTDSVYSDEYPRGTVIQQNPLPGKEVKNGRTIFITLNSVLPEMLAMPDLMGKSKRIAIPMLEISGLELDVLSYKPDESCTDCVLDQIYEGKTIEPGTRIRKGQKITLVLGRQSNEQANVPGLLGKKYKDAAEVLNSVSLNIGEVLSCSGCNSGRDTSNAFVINQRPEPGKSVGLGAFIDVYLSTDSTFAETMESPNDTTIYEMD